MIQWPTEEGSTVSRESPFEEDTDAPVAKHRQAVQSSGLTSHETDMEV
jgi:hypothetical protein